MNFLKGAVIFAVGVGVGASTSYVYFKKQYDEKKAELIELREHYNNKMQHEVDIKTAEEIIEKEKYVSYNKMNEEVREVIKEVTAEALATESPSEDYPEQPIQISEEDYTERELYFDKLEMDYYIGDGALVDENEELVEVEDVLGYDILEEFINDESEDVIYIRNAAKSSDYMVRKISGSFSEIVGVGGGDDD